MLLYWKQMATRWKLEAEKASTEQEKATVEKLLHDAEREIKTLTEAGVKEPQAVKEEY